jgi:hypothetical protein
LKSLKDVKPGDKIFVLNSNRGYLKEPQIEILTVNKVGILYIYTDYDKYRKSIYPDLYTYRRKQDEYVEFTQNCNSIDKVTVITNAMDYINKLKAYGR